MPVQLEAVIKKWNNLMCKFWHLSYFSDTFVRSKKLLQFVIKNYIVYSFQLSILSDLRSVFLRCDNCPIVKLGSSEANRREPKSCLGWVFNFKLGCFVMYAIPWDIQARLSLELKTRPRFCPASFSLSMFKHLVCKVGKYWAHRI